MARTGGTGEELASLVWFVPSGIGTYVGYKLAGGGVAGVLGAVGGLLAGGVLVYLVLAGVAGKT